MNQISSNFNLIWTAPQSWQDGSCSIRVSGGLDAVLLQIAEHVRAQSLHSRITSIGGIPWIQISPQPFPVDSIPLGGAWRPAKDSVFRVDSIPKKLPKTYSVFVDVSRIDVDTAKSLGIDIGNILGYFSTSGLIKSRGGVTIDAVLRQQNILDSIKRTHTYSFSFTDSMYLEIGQEYKEQQAKIDYKEGNSVIQYSTLLSGFQMSFYVDSSNDVGRYSIRQLGTNRSNVSSSMLFGDVVHNFEGIDSHDSLSGWWIFSRKTKIRHRILYSVRIRYLNGLDTADT